MKLSLSTCSLNEYLKEGYSEFDTLAAIKEAGFTCVDYDIHASLYCEPEKNGRYAKENLEKLGMTVPQAHAPGINPVDPANRERLSEIRDAIRFCGFAGIPAIVVHPGGMDGFTEEEFFEKNVAFYQSLIPVCEETEVKLLVENIGNYADPYWLWDGKDLRNMVEAIGSELAFACWDVGHANHFYRKDVDPYQSILDVGDKLYATHVHDNCGYFTDPIEHHRIDMHTMPYGSVWCNVNFDAVVKGLVDADYKGTFNLESMVCNPRIVPQPLTVNGETFHRLRILPMKAWIACNRGLYEVGKAMLEAYDAFEE